MKDQSWLTSASLAIVNGDVPSPPPKALFQSLTSARESQAAPTIPGDWQQSGSLVKTSQLVSMLASGRAPKPWGTLADARRLLADNLIAEGRELLWRLISDAGSVECVAALCYDYGRTQPDADLAVRLRDILPRSDQASVAAIKALPQGDIGAGLSALESVLKSAPTSAYAASLLLLAFVSWSDAALQAVILAPYNRAQTALRVTQPVRASQLLVLRDRQTAWDVFCDGYDEAEVSVKGYETFLNVNIAPEMLRALTAEYQSFCRLGQLMVLYDACLDEAASVAALYAGGFVRNSSFSFGASLAAACDVMFEQLK